MSACLSFFLLKHTRFPPARESRLTRFLTAVCKPRLRQQPAETGATNLDII